MCPRCVHVFGRSGGPRCVVPSQVLEGHAAWYQHEFWRATLRRGRVPSASRRDRSAFVGYMRLVQAAHCLQFGCGRMSGYVLRLLQECWHPWGVAPEGGVEVATGVGAKQPAILCCPVTMSRCRQVSQSAEPVGKRLAGLRRARRRCYGRQVRAELQRRFCPGQRSGGLRESNGFLGLRPNIRNIIGRWADPKIREIWTVTLRRGRIWVLPIGRIWRATLCRGRIWAM